MKPVGKALLVGNGLNRAAGLEASWESIVKELFSIPLNEPLPPRMNLTPFPLLVEEAFSPTAGGTGEAAVQGKLASRLQEWSPGDVHRQLLSLDVRHILTTNYDLVLESASQHQLVKPEKPFQKERRYSVFRRNLLADGKRVWHMHGSIQAPPTMVLGFEHYAGHLHIIRHSVVDVRRYTQRTYGPVKKMIRELGDREPMSWLEVALSHHIMILGLSLAFAELGLWWLLTYRARMLKDSPSALPNTRIIFANNPGEPDQDRKDALLAQLRACNVEVIDFARDWPSFYSDAFAFFQTLRI